jgi:hypothetical protein
MPHSEPAFGPGGAADYSPGQRSAATAALGRTRVQSNPLPARGRGVRGVGVWTEFPTTRQSTPCVQQTDLWDMLTLAKGGLERGSHC